MSSLSDCRDQYNHALKRIYELFKYGFQREEKLEKALELARDELQRILVCPGANNEIKQLCERGLSMTKDLLSEGE